MANKLLSQHSDDRVYRHCVSYIVLFDNVLLLHNRVLWALYARDEDKFLSEFIFTKPPDLPKFGQEDVWTLHIGEQVVLFDSRARVSIVTEEVAHN